MTYRHSATGAAEEVIRELLDQTEYRQHLADESRDNGNDRLANLDELITAARQFDEEHGGASIQDFLAEITLASPIDRWDQETGAVTLMTLHAAKGLEFPVVFIVALEQNILPHSRANDDSNQLEEERRLLFVGITRARRELFLSRCMVRSFRGQQQATLPSRFLSEFPEEPIVVRDLSGVGQSNIRPRQAARHLAGPSERTSANRGSARIPTDDGGGPGWRPHSRRVPGGDAEPTRSSSPSSRGLGASPRIWAGSDRGDRGRGLRPQGAGRVRRGSGADVCPGQGRPLRPVGKPPRSGGRQPLANGSTANNGRRLELTFA